MSLTLAENILRERTRHGADAVRLAQDVVRLTTENARLSTQRTVDVGPFGMTPKQAADELHDEHVELLTLRKTLERVRSYANELVNEPLKADDVAPALLELANDARGKVAKILLAIVDG